MEKYSVSENVYLEWRKHKPIINSAIVLFNEDGNALIVRRSFGANKGKWEFPSGSLEREETPEMAAFRELEEETRIKIDIPLTEIGIFRIVSDDKTDFVFSYLGRVANNTPVTLSWEHDEYRWVCLEDTISLPFHPDVRKILIKAFSVGNK